MWKSLDCITMKALTCNLEGEGERHRPKTTLSGESEVDIKIMNST